MKKYLKSTILTVMLILSPLALMGQVTVVQNGKPVKMERWIAAQFGKGKTPPFSFEYGGVHSAQLLPSCCHIPCQQQNRRCGDLY